MVLERFRVDDKVAIVTGASRGIGRASALALAEAGADVVIGARNAESLAEVAAAIEAMGRRAWPVAADLSEREALEDLVQAAIDHGGRLDIVVNNVGGSFPRAFLETSPRAFEKAFAWNVTTAFNLTQLATPYLLDSGHGSVVNIASAIGRFAARGAVAYGVAKAAMLHLTRNLAQDLAPRVRVNAVAPGSIATDALQLVLDDDDLADRMRAGTPLRRIGDPDEIAAAVLYLASPASAYTTAT
jgi:7-alpha-hydroxysteroid dehydrogenase